MARAKGAGTPWQIALVELPTDAGSRRELVQTLAQSHRLPVIGIGSINNEQDRQLLEKLGMRRLLRDPVRPSALHDCLSTTLSINTTDAATSGTTSQSRTETKPSLPAPTISGHVLVAEDNHINQMYVTELLKHCGCTCDVVSNGDEALTAIQQREYDLILMDCQMPEMDGFTASREIRRRESTGQLAGHHKIIALTANALKGDREHCLDAGMDDYLTKPIEAAQLQTMLASHLAACSAQSTS